MSRHSHFMSVFIAWEIKRICFLKNEFDESSIHVTKIFLYLIPVTRKRDYPVHNYTY
ncbi:hypothetical protein Hanom_Chr06g00530541 [Helianthus anomalus]